jgi:hypothetical protein
MTILYRSGDSLAEVAFRPDFLGSKTMDPLPAQFSASACQLGGLGERDDSTKLLTLQTNVYFA